MHALRIAQHRGNAQLRARPRRAVVPIFPQTFPHGHEIGGTGFFRFVISVKEHVFKAVRITGVGVAVCREIVVAVPHGVGLSADEINVYRFIFRRSGNRIAAPAAAHGDRSQNRGRAQKQFFHNFPSDG